LRLQAGDVHRQLLGKAAKRKKKKKKKKEKGRKRSKSTRQIV
jgi:hypothetical protein